MSAEIPPLHPETWLRGLSSERAFYSDVGGGGGVKSDPMGHQGKHEGQSGFSGGHVPLGFVCQGNKEDINSASNDPWKGTK